jgi:hypothetical protein
MNWASLPEREQYKMTWTGIATDLTLHDVIGAADTGSHLPPPAASAIAAANPKPSSFRLFLRRNRERLFLTAAALFGLVAVQSYYWITDAVKEYRFERERAAQDIVYQQAIKAAEAREKAKSATGGPAAPSSMAAPAPTGPQEVPITPQVAQTKKAVPHNHAAVTPSASVTGGDTPVESGSAMSLEHFRELSGKL